MSSKPPNWRTLIPNTVSVVPVYWLIGRDSRFMAAKKATKKKVGSYEVVYVRLTMDSSLMIPHQVLVGYWNAVNIHTHYFYIIYSILYYILLYILYYIILYYIYYTILYYTILYFTILYYTILYIWYDIILFYIIWILYYIFLYFLYLIVIDVDNKLWRNWMNVHMNICCVWYIWFLHKHTHTRRYI